MNYYRKPHRYRKKQSVFKNRIFLTSLAGFALFLGFVYLMFLSPFLQAKEIEVEREAAEEKPGVSAVSEEILQEAERLVDSALNSGFLFWETRSMFLFDSKGAEKRIMETYPELAKAEIKKKWPDKIGVKLGRKEGVALLSRKEGFFLLASAGEIFGAAMPADQSLPVLIKPDYISDKSVVSKEDLGQILYLNGQLESLGVGVSNFLLFSQDKLVVTTSEGWEIYCTLKKDLDWQVAKLKTVLEEYVPAERRGDLEYIEVRFSNLIYPKYKD